MTVSYKDIKKVYSIIFYEESPKEFHAFPQNMIHRSKQQTDTGLEMELLQEFLFVPLDISKKIYENGGIGNKLEAWFIFLSDDNPETIQKLIDAYPKFREMYEEVYDLCLNTERVMEMYSKELLELDRNTVLYMIDEMQNEIDEQKVKLEEKDTQLQEQEIQLREQKTLLQEKEAVLENERAEIARLKAILQQANIEVE